MAIDWMKHPLNAREQQNVAKMMMKNGMAGYGAFWALNELLMNEEAHQVEPDYNVLGYRLHCDAGLIKSVASEFGLYVFTEDGEYMHSELVDNQAEQIGETSSKRAAAGKRGANKRWQDDSKAMASAKQVHGKAIASAKQVHGKAIASAKQVHGKAIASDSRLDKTKTRQDKTKDTPLTPQGAGERVLNPEEEFAVEIWPAYPKKGGNYQAGMQAYVQAVATGETTKAAVLAKIADYKAYIALNKIGSGYVKAGGNWFSGHGWKNEYDTKTPEKPANKQRFGKPKRHEATPEWMQEGYEAPKQEVTEADKAELAEQLKELEQLRKGKDEDANTKTMA